MSAKSSALQRKPVTVSSITSISAVRLISTRSTRSTRSARGRGPRAAGDLRGRGRGGPFKSDMRVRFKRRSTRAGARCRGSSCTNWCSYSVDPRGRKHRSRRLRHRGFYRRPVVNFPQVPLLSACLFPSSPSPFPPRFPGFAPTMPRQRVYSRSRRLRRRGFPWLLPVNLPEAKPRLALLSASPSPVPPRFPGFAPTMPRQRVYSRSRRLRRRGFCLPAGVSFPQRETHHHA
jgi:hypothetical protein